MAHVKVVQGESKLLTKNYSQGAIYFTTDECIYLALDDGTFKMYGHYISVDTMDELPESANDQVMYYVKEKKSLYRYDGEWENIGASDVKAQADALQQSINSITMQQGYMIEDISSVEDTANKNTSRIDAIEEDYLTSTDKESLEEKITEAKAEVIETILGKDVDADFDTLKEVAEWISTDTTNSAQLMTKVTNLEDAVSENFYTKSETYSQEEADAKFLTEHPEVEKDSNYSIDKTLDYSDNITLFGGLSTDVNGHVTRTTKYRLIMPSVDEEFSETSTNPVQNAVITAALNKKADIISVAIPAGRATGDIDGDGRITETDISMMEAHNDGTAPITDETAVLCANMNDEGIIEDGTLAMFNLYVTGSAFYMPPKTETDSGSESTDPYVSVTKKSSDNVETVATTEPVAVFDEYVIGSTCVEPTNPVDSTAGALSVGQYFVFDTAANSNLVQTFYHLTDISIADDECTLTYDEYKSAIVISSGDLITSTTVTSGALTDVLGNWTFGKQITGVMEGENGYVYIGSESAPRWGDFYINIPIDGCTRSSDVRLMFDDTPSYYDFRAKPLDGFVRVATVIPPIEEMHCNIVCEKDGTGSVAVYYPSSIKNTPQKGVDYWTDEDKQEIINEVLATLKQSET